MNGKSKNMLSKIWYNNFTSCFWFLHLSLKLRFFAYVMLSVPFAHLLWKSKCLLMPKFFSYINVLHLFGMLSPSQFQQCPLCWGYNPKKHQQPPKSTTMMSRSFPSAGLTTLASTLWTGRGLERPLTSGRPGTWQWAWWGVSSEAQNSLSQLVWNKCLHIEICIFFCCQSDIRYVTKVGHWMMGSHFFCKIHTSIGCSS